MNRVLTVALVSLMSVFAGQASASSEIDFWWWFQANQEKLFDFERDQERIFDRLAAEMHKVDSNLTFEIGPKKNGQREFIISADGIRDAFPKVAALYAAAPALPNWIIVKFRPRREPFDIHFGDHTIQAGTVSVILQPQGEKVGLTMIIPGYNTIEHDTYATIGYLFLDQALGEFDVETRVGEIQFQSPSSHRPGTTSLRELPTAFDAYFEHRNP